MTNEQVTANGFQPDATGSDYRRDAVRRRLCHLHSRHRRQRFRAAGGGSAVGSRPRTAAVRDRERHLGAGQGGVRRRLACLAGREHGAAHQRADLRKRAHLFSYHPKRMSPLGIGRITVYVPARAALAAREGARMAEASVVVILLALVPERAALLARPADD